MFRYVYQDKLGKVVHTKLTHVTWEDKVTEVRPISTYIETYDHHAFGRDYFKGSRYFANLLSYRSSMMSASY